MKKIVLVYLILLLFSVFVFTACTVDDEPNITTNETFVVHFETFGGSKVTALHLQDGEKATRPETNPTNHSLMFYDWYMDRECTILFDFENVTIRTNISIYARWVSAEEVFYYQNNQSVTITALTQIGKNVTEIIIPDTINGTTVVAIEENAFDDSINMNSLFISCSVTDVPVNLFDNVKNLHSITLGCGIDHSNYEFLHTCADLVEIFVCLDNLSFSSLDGVLYSKDKTEIYKFPPAKTGEYEIPSTVTTIQSYAFSFCDKLEKLSFSSEINYITATAFYGSEGFIIYVIGSSQSNNWQDGWNGSCQVINKTS